MADRQGQLSVEPVPRYTRVDRALAGIGFYGLARKRVAQRYALELEQRYYLEAAQKGRNRGDWQKVGSDDINIPGNERQVARRRARWQVANNGYAIRARDAIENNVIGEGISTQAQIAYSSDKNINRRKNTDVEDLKKRWQEQADASGKQEWFDIQSMIVGEQVEAGEILLYKRFLFDDYRNGRRVLPLAYEVIDANRLTSFGTSPQEGNKIQEGIEFTKDGRPVAYWIEENSYRYKVQKLPAEFMYHHFRMDRPGQRRGITWMAPVLSDLTMLKDIKWYAMVQRKVQSAIAAIVSEESDSGTSGRPGMPGLKPGANDTKTTAEGDPKRFLEPGMIHNVGKGRVTTLTPNPAGDLDTLTKFVLRGIGVALGLSYEYLAGDYSDVTFASGRLAGQHTNKKVDILHSRYIRQAEKPVHKDFIDDAMRVGKISPPKKGADPYAAQFSRPKKEKGVNPYQEVQASVKSIQNCLTSVREEISDSGRDPDQVYKTIERDLEQGGKVGDAIQKIILGEDQ